MSDAFILGAGFSKAIDDQMPTLVDLSKSILPVIRAEHPRLADEVEALGNNVELWMSFLSQSQPWLSDAQVHRHLSLAHSIRKHICSVIDEQVTRIKEVPQWLNDLVKKWHDRQATVLTLNYDTLIERVACGLPLPRDEEDKRGKGLLPSYLYPPYFELISGRGGQGGWASQPQDTFSLLKLHGSTNWYYSGQPDFYGETIFYAIVSPIGEDVSRKRRQLMQAEEERQRKQAGDKVPLVIPPVTEKRTYFNNETVKRLWQEAASALRSAERVFLIGYSLPATDVGMLLFLSTVLASRSNSIDVVDIDDGVPKRLQELLRSTPVNDRYVRSDRPVREFAKDYCRT